MAARKGKGKAEQGQGKGRARGGRGKERGRNTDRAPEAQATPQTDTRWTTRLPTQPPERAWQELQGLDVQKELKVRVPTLQNVPAWFRGRWLFAYRWALEELTKQQATRVGTEEALLQRWRLVLLLPRMLLRRMDVRGRAGKVEMARRYECFLRGHW